MRSRTTRSMRSRPNAEGVLDQLAVGADAAVAEVVDVVLRPMPLLCSMRWPTMAAMSSLLIVRSVGRLMPMHGNADSFLLSL